MTFNIRQGRARRWYRRRELVFETIRQYQPHVLAAQEVQESQLGELLEATDGYAAIALRRYGGLVGAYLPILFDRERLEPAQSGDFWLSPEPDGDRRRGWDALMPRLCAWTVFRDKGSGMRRFVVFNTHLDSRGAEARLNSAHLVIDRLRGFDHLPRLLCGDLNANEESQPVRTLIAGGLLDTYRVARPDESPSFTYHRFHGHRSKGDRGKIDYILCDEHWTVVGADIVRSEFDGRLPSDHYPVTADLVLDGETRL